MITNNHYDVLHLNCNSATGALDLMICKSIPIRIAYCHASGSLYPVAHWLLKPLFNRLYLQAVASSEIAGKWAFGNKKFLVLNNAIELDKFSFSETIRYHMRHAYNINDDCLVIGHVGKMGDTVKNQQFLIDIFPEVKRRLPNSILFFVGDGKYMEALKEQARKNGSSDSVVFAGFHINVNEYMQIFDIFVFPSKYEGLGMVAIEAQASGLRCIMSDHIPHEAVVTDRAEYIGITDDDKKKWIARIVEILKYYNEDERRESILKVQEQIRQHKYDISSEIWNLLSIYNH